jgi:soluble lytic murein transglycosylase
VWLAGARKRIDEALFYLSKLSRSDPYYTYLSAYVKMRSGQYREAKRLFLKSSVPKRYYYLIYLASSPKERLKYYKKFLSQPLSTSLKRRAAIGNLDYFFRKDLSLFKEALAATNRKELKDIYLYFRDRYRVFKRGCTRAISNAVPQKWWKSACGLSRELPRGINFYSLFLNPPKKFPYDREKVFSSLKLEDPGLAYLYYKGYCNILSLIEEKTPQTALAMNLCGEYKKGIRFALPFRGKLKEHPYLLAVLYPKPPVFGDDLVSLAIARQESLFDPLALSRSGARGLMQIMPATGRYIAKKLKERDYHTGRLYEEELNYRFGSYYIHSLLEKFGLFPLAAAAYNGGPSRVKKALELYGEIREPKDVILFNDIYIPFHETRDYVRKTSVNLYYYSNLYGSGEEWRIFLKP